MSEIQLIKELKKAREIITQAYEDKDLQSVMVQLRRLKKVTVTESALRASAIGLFINKLRQKPDAEVVSLAKEVVLKWKADVQHIPKTDGKAASTKSDNASDKSAPGTPGSAPPTRKSSASPAAPKPQRVRPKERTPQGDGLKPKQLEDTYRDRIRTMLYSALAFGNEIAGETLLPFATEIEETVHTSCGGTGEAYKSQIMTLSFNIRDVNNPDLNERILSKALSVGELCAMSPEELASDTKKQQIEQFRATSLFKVKGAGAPQAETDMFKCGKCKQRKCTYYQKQTRSADEPMTTFVTCVNCDNKWKFC